jgi:alpha-L-fucosidase
VVGGTFQDTKTKPYTAQDFRFTTGNGHLYAIELGWPASGMTTVRSIRPDDKVTRVQLLADGSDVSFTQDAGGLHLRLPSHPVGSDAYVFRITLATANTTKATR